MPWRAPRRLALAAVLLAGAGCDEAIDPDPEDTRFAFLASVQNVCPQPGGTGESELTVVAYGPNGDTLEGKRVRFATTAGSVNPDAGMTSRRGRVQTILAVPRTPTLTVTAEVEDAGSQTLDLFAPAPIELRGPFRETAVFTDPDGDGTIEVAKQILVSAPCHVQEIRFRLSYDPAILAFVELRDFDALGAFLGDGGTATATDLGGVLEVVLTRDAAAGGFTLPGIVVATDVVFHGLADGTSSFALSAVAMTDPLGSPYDVAIGSVAPTEIDFTP